MTATQERSILRPRSPGVDLDAPLPRHWLGGNVVATHIANGVNLLFPAGERFFVRSVKHYMDRVKDPVLRQQIRGFFGQEGSHAREHERATQLLEEQGFNVQAFLRFYDAVAFKVIEKLSPPELRLASTAACEHFTAIMAENSMRRRELDFASPVMRGLLMWHAAEEIEHRAVAFDVLREVNPSYALRIAGLVMATLTLSGFWWLGTASLVLQDDAITWDRWRADWKAISEFRAGESIFVRGIRDYLRPDFHPSQNDIDGLAREYLASAGLA